MIGDRGVFFWMYFILYFQFLFIFDLFDFIKEGEFVDVENVDIFDFFVCVDYYLCYGDLELVM